MTLEERLNKAEEMIQKPSFRQNKGLGNEVGYYIFDYPAEQELFVRERVEYIRKKNEQSADEYRIVVFDLYNIIIEILKDKVTVLRRIRFIDDEVDYGDFLSNVYLIKIDLGCHESIPIYLAYDDPYYLEEHYVLYKTDRDKKYHVTKKLKTFIYIDKYNKNQYISLSELCD